jgi:hypothetical protein
MSAFNKLPKYSEFIGRVDAVAGGLITDNIPHGKLILGYRIQLVGTSAAAAPVNFITGLGPIVMQSAVGASLISEANFGFINHRTAALVGGTRHVQPVNIGDPVDLSFIHCFDLAGGAHGNVYPAQSGDAIEIILPAVAVVQAGTMWEVQRYVVPEGYGHYLPRWQDRGLTIAESRFDFNGHTASLICQPASVTAPARLSVFTPDEARRMFATWNGFLADTNAWGNFDSNEATMGEYKLFSADPSSVINCLGIDQLTFELQGGVGTMRVSHCTVEPMPEALMILAKRETMKRRALLMANLEQLNIARPSALAAATQLAESSGSSATMIQAGASALATSRAKATSIPITPGFSSPKAAARVVTAMSRG